MLVRPCTDRPYRALRYEPGGTFRETAPATFPLTIRSYVVTHLLSDNDGLRLGSS